MWNALEKEQRIGSHLKVRRWNHRGANDLTAPESVHTAVELCWLEQGEATYFISGQRYTVTAGQLMLVPAGVDHTTAFTGGLRAGSIWLGADALAELSDAVGARAPLAAGVVEDAGGLIALAKMVQAEAFDPDPGAQLAADSLSDALALKVLRLQPRDAHAGPRAPGIRRAVEQIEMRYAEELSLEELARTAAMSRFHFARRFKVEVGESPYAYLQAVRLRRAAELLKRGHASVTEAAFSTGFTDLGRFGRKFRQRYGCTPRAFSGR